MNNSVLRRQLFNEIDLIYTDVYKFKDIFPLLLLQCDVGDNNVFELLLWYKYNKESLNMLSSSIYYYTTFLGNHIFFELRFISILQPTYGILTFLRFVIYLWLGAQYL